MGQQIQCPNCGSPQTSKNPGIRMLVCEHCSSTLYWDEQAVLQAGKKSILPEADTRLFDGATGQLNGKNFEVIGHVRYAHASGHWDEWYLALADGETIWLSEDARKLTLETPVSAKTTLPAAGQLQVGRSLNLDGTYFTVRELGEATCIGGWGQLPFTLLPDSKYQYADLASKDGQHFATLEYDQTQQPHCFIGQALEHGQLTVKDQDGTLQAIETRSESSDSIQCASCAAPLKKPAAQQEIQTLVCEYCGSQNDLSGAAAEVMGKNPKQFNADFIYEIGQQARFSGIDYAICGRQLNTDDEGYVSRLYLLWHEKKGYLYLEESENEYTLLHATLSAPNADPFDLDEGEWIKVNKKPYRFIEDGSNKVTYVDGAFPWKVACGDQSDYADFKNGQKRYSVERSRNEIEYFTGRTLSAYQLENAFNPPKTTESTSARKQETGPVGFLKKTAFYGLLIAVIAFSTLIALASFESLFSAYTLIAAATFAPALWFISRKPDGFLWGLLYIASLLIAVVAPLALLLPLLLLPLFKQIPWAILNRLTIPLVLAIVVTGLMTLDYFDTLKNNALQASSDYEQTQKQLSALSQGSADVLQKEPWVSTVYPASAQWQNQINQQRQHLQQLKRKELNQLQTILAQDSSWALTSTPALVAVVNQVLVPVNYERKTISDKLQELRTFKKNLPQKLKQYQFHYNLTQPAFLQKLQQRKQQAIKLWSAKNPQVATRLNAVWQQGKFDQIDALSAQTRKLWSANLEAYQQAKAMQISPAVYQELPKAWDNMAQLTLSVQKQGKELTGLMRTLNTQWETQLVDMEIIEGNEIQFFHTYQIVTTTLSDDALISPDNVKSKLEQAYQNHIARKRVKVSKTLYNQQEPFMGMTLEYKKLGQFQPLQHIIPLGYSFLSPLESEKNYFGFWRQGQWQWLPPYAQWSKALWGAFYRPTFSDMQAFLASGQRPWLARQQSNRVRFGNLGAFSLAMFAGSKYYLNNRYRQSRYITSGRTWRGTRYESSSSSGSYRGSSSSGSYSGGGK
ncbi:DUF4178 domain-containing protein [Candidatus Venteria ishoeyi]|uniref:DUF4178 domain-containing protein n=1 Tax=Candidatus Venteria ishoeyi TaxID=1899563 RepID=A0A1H6FFR0_9GAMM|nr:DUF4178 domain-containing protein [Candidatus Venteria ishoeyi]SEH08918.1 Uncharacterised protein [Candidatus Venteria ishoeyi]